MGQEGGRRKRAAGAAEHGRGDAGHGWLGLNVQVAIHLIGAPATNETDAIAVNAPAQEGHGAARPRGAGREEYGVGACAPSEAAASRNREVRA